MFYGEMDWQRPGPAWMVGDVAFVSVSVEMGEGASPPFAASIDSEKLPSSPCLRGVVGGSTSSWFLVPIHHPFRLRMHGLISLGPSVTAETHLAMAREEDGQQDLGLCVCLLGTRGLQRRAVWRPGTQLLWTQGLQTLFVILKIVFLYDHVFLLLLSFSTCLRWLSLRVGTIIVFSDFNRYKLNIYKHL